MLAQDCWRMSLHSHPHSILLFIVKGICLSFVAREIRDTKVGREFLIEDVYRERGSCKFHHSPDLLGYVLHSYKVADLVSEGVVRDGATLFWPSPAVVSEAPFLGGNWLPELLRPALRWCLKSSV